MPKDTEFLPFEIELNGKLNTADSSLAIGKNFRSLKNLRYDDANPKGVSGMTRINDTNALDSDHQHVQNAFHFVKDTPAESHVLVQTVNTSDAAPAIVQNTKAIPEQGDFEGGATTTELYTEDTVAEVARFSDAPNGQVSICDGKESLIWGGDESRVGAALTSEATITTALTNPKDYTSKVQNSSDDSDQRLILGGTTGLALLLHCEGADASTTFTDSVGTHTPTAVGNAQIDVDYLKFGSASGLFDGTGDYLTIPDHADFDFSDENYLMDAWVRPQQGNVIPYTIFSQRSDANNWIHFYITSDVALLLHCEGADASTTFTDSGRTVHTVTANGNAQIDTSQFKFGSASGYFDGTGDYLTIPDHADFDWSADNKFTIDGWFRTESQGGSNVLYYQQTNNDNRFFITINISTIPTLTIIEAAATQALSVPAEYYLTNEEWTHIAWVGDGTNYYIFVNGVLAAKEAVSSNCLNYTGVNIYIGSESAGIANYKGWIDEFRVIKGLATWSGAAASVGDTVFTPPTNRYKILHPALDLRIGGSTETLRPDTTKGETIDWDTWHHVQLDADGTNHYLFTDGQLQNAGGTNMTNAPTNFTQLVHICGHHDNVSVDDEFKGHIDELRVATTGNKTADFTVKTIAYRSDGVDFLVGSTRPLKGCKFYIPIGNGNPESATLTMKEWNGSSWSSITISDNTSGLAQTGTVTWSSTVDTSRIRYFEGWLLYWYNFTLTAGNVDIYQITVDAPVQKSLDIWDGELRTIFSYQIFSDSNFNDYTVNITSDSYDTGNSSTYVTEVAPATALNALATATEYQYVGSLERLTGLEIHIIGGQVNAAVGTMGIAYWDGSAWVDATNVIDGTLEGGITFAKSGVITWQVPDEAIEFKKQIAKGIPLYFYRLHGTANFSAVDIQVYYIAGIPAQNRIGNFRFPLMADNCLWLCDDIDYKRNEVLRSFPNAPDVFNGVESFRIPFGDEKKLTCATVLNSRKDDRVFDVKLFYKFNSMHGLTGNNQENYSRFEISRTIGCPAPLTLDTTILEIEGKVIPIAIWQGANGLYIYNDFKPIPIHRDIRNFFDKNESVSRRINKTYIASSIGFVDEEKREYHWLFADGNSIGTLNREFVFDLRRFRWFEIPRGTGKELQCGITVEDTDGNNYNYGFIDTGYMERLENGTDFDGTDITAEFQIGDVALYEESSMYQTIIRHLKLIMGTKATTTNTASMTHYGDGNNTATADFNNNDYDPTKLGYDFTDISKSVNLGNFVHHSLKATMVTDDETVGFSPIKIGGFYKVVREDKGKGG